MTKINYPIYLHIGYPKAASTTFQSSLFYKNPNINDFSPYKAWKTGDKNILRLFNLLNQGGDKEEIFNLFEKHVVPKLSQTKPNIFSSEFWIKNDNILLKLEQLKLLFSDYSPKILVITRNQYDFLKSLYYFLGGSFDNLEFKSLSSWLQFQLESDQAWLETLDFHQSLQYYANWVGSSNIGIFFFEEMVYNPENFANNVSSFINIDKESFKEILYKKEKANSSYSGKLKTIKKKLPLLEKISLRSVLPKPIYKSLKLNLTKVAGSIPKEDFSEQHKQFIYDKYSQSNLKLAKTFSIPQEEMKKYNYPL